MTGDEPDHGPLPLWQAIVGVLLLPTLFVVGLVGVYPRVDIQVLAILWLIVGVGTAVMLFVTRRKSHK